MLANILTTLGVILLLWILYKGIRGNPGVFSKENMNKSLTTLGVLALILIGIISFAVMMLK